MEQPQEEPSEKELESFQVAFTARSLASQAIIAAQNWLEQVRIESEMQRAKKEDLERRQKLKLEKEQQRMARELAARAVVNANNSLMQEELDQYVEQMRKERKKEKDMLRVSKAQDRAARELACHAILTACKSLDKAKIKRETENDVEQHEKQLERGKKLEKQFTGNTSSSKLDPGLRESEKTKGTETSDPRRSANIRENAKQSTKQAAWAQREISQRALVSAKLSSDRFELQAEMKKSQQQIKSQQPDIRENCAKEIVDHEIQLANYLEKVKFEDSLSKTGRETSEEEIVNQKDIHEICAKKIVQEAIVSAQASVERAELKDLLSKTLCQFDKEEVINEKEINLMVKTSKHAELIIENALIVLESTGQALKTDSEELVNEDDYVVLTHEEAKQANFLYENLRKEAICKGDLKNVEDINDQANLSQVNTPEVFSFCDEIVNSNYLPELILTEDEKKEVEIDYRRIEQELQEEEDEDTSKTECKTLECQDISTKVSRYVGNVISSVLSILKQGIPNTDSEVNTAQVTFEHAHKRRTSVHFSEPAKVYVRRDSTYRPPTPRFLKWSKSGVDEELWEEEDELGREDMDLEKEESTLSARYEILEDKNSDVSTSSLVQVSQ